MVAGGGIGGLTAAIALRRAGVEVRVFERAAELQEVGAGLLLAANAQKALGKLGLAEAVASLGTPASAGEIRSWRGEVLASIPAPSWRTRSAPRAPPSTGLTCRRCSCRRWGREHCAWAPRWKAFEQDEGGVTGLARRRCRGECRPPRGRRRSATRDPGRTVRSRGAPLRRLHGLAGGGGTREGALAVGHGLRVVGEGSQVRVRPHRRRQGLLVRHQERPRGREGRPAR